MMGLEMSQHSHPTANYQIVHMACVNECILIDGALIDL